MSKAGPLRELVDRLPVCGRKHFGHRLPQRQPELGDVLGLIEGGDGRAVAPAANLRGRRHFWRGALRKEFQAVNDAAWEKRDGISSAPKGPVRDAVETAIAGLDDGTYRTAEKFGDEWVVNQWLKKAVLLSFRLYDSVPMDGGASFPGLGAAPWFDKVPLKTTGWDAKRFAKAGFRAVPGSIVRRGSYVTPSVVVMPAFINLGAYVDTGTMVATWPTLGSCPQTANNSHLPAAFA